jgi:hypothetical protein
VPPASRRRGRRAPPSTPPRRDSRCSDSGGSSGADPQAGHVIAVYRLYVRVGHPQRDGLFGGGVRASDTSPSVWRTVPERVCRAETVFPWVGAYRSRQAYVACFPGSFIPVMSAFLPLLRLWDSSRLSSPREVAIVLFQARLLPTHSFARYRSRVSWAALPGKTAPGRCGRIWCEFLAVRATPSRATCCWPRPLLAAAAASTVRLELAPTGGILSCHRTTPIEQPGRSFARLLSFLVCPIRRPRRAAYNNSDLGRG